jgi:hypothetical protein
LCQVKSGKPSTARRQREGGSGFDGGAGEATGALQGHVGFVRTQHLLHLTRAFGALGISGFLHLVVVVV